MSVALYSSLKCANPTLPVLLFLCDVLSKCVIVDKKRQTLHSVLTIWGPTLMLDRVILFFVFVLFLLDCL